MQEGLIFLSKRLIDIAKEIEDLNEDEKTYIIKQAEKLDHKSLIELYNILGEYGQL